MSVLVAVIIIVIDLANCEPIITGVECDQRFMNNYIKNSQPKTGSAYNFLHGPYWGKNGPGRELLMDLVVSGKGYMDCYLSSGSHKIIDITLDNRMQPEPQVIVYQIGENMLFWTMDSAVKRRGSSKKPYKVNFKVTSEPDGTAGPKKAFVYCCPQN